VRNPALTVSVSISDKRDNLICPKPRRLGVGNTIINDPITSLRWHISHQQEVSDPNSGSELFDIIFPKGSYGTKARCGNIAVSHPFFFGSPPSRVSNPLIQDARFREDKITQILSPKSIPQIPATTTSPTSSRKGGLCNRSNFGNNPAVRVEGFDCLDRDSRNCSIPTLA
jgi:hypothetical protein